MLRPGRDKSLRRLHPWIFSGAVAGTRGSPNPGDTVRVVSTTGDDLGVAAYSPESQLRARMWSFEPDIVVDDEFVTRRVVESATRRARLSTISNSARLIFSEADGLPGVIADRYDDCVVVQFGSAGAERWRQVIADALSVGFEKVGRYQWWQRPLK